jgi:3',5'-cyclic AMP phosphodiesterase CpdA
MSKTIVAVADLHGHRMLLDALVVELDRDLGGDYTLVPLGDYVDNGPQIPALLDRLIDLRAERGERFAPVLGNHDLACLLAMGWDGGPPNRAWCQNWASRYWNSGGETSRAYGAESAEALARKMPPAHRAFLQSLPWYLEADGYVFVHAGLRPGPVAPQLEELARRQPLPGTHLHDQLRDKALAVVSDPSWGRVVVSGHTHRPRGGRPHFVTPHRITLSSEADHTATLWAVALPDRCFYRVDRTGAVTRGKDAEQLDR